MQLKVRRWRDNLYGSCMYLLVGPADEAQRWLGRNLDVDTDEADWEVGAFTMSLEKEGCSVIVLWFPRFHRNNVTDMSMLAHECFHATDITLRLAGLELAVASSEAYAYHIGWMYQQCLSKLKR